MGISYFLGYDLWKGGLNIPQIGMFRVDDQHYKGNIVNGVERNDFRTISLPNYIQNPNAYNAKGSLNKTKEHLRNS